MADWSAVVCGQLQVLREIEEEAKAEIAWCTTEPLRIAQLERRCDAVRAWRDRLLHDYDLHGEALT